MVTVDGIGRLHHTETASGDEPLQRLDRFGRCFARSIRAGDVGEIRRVLEPLVGGPANVGACRHQLAKVPTTSGLSVELRTTTTGRLTMLASSCTPPESEIIMADSASRPRKSRYPIGGVTRSRSRRSCRRILPPVAPIADEAAGRPVPAMPPTVRESFRTGQVVDVLRSVEGREDEPAGLYVVPGQQELPFVFGREQPFHRFNHRVPGQHNPIAGDTLGRQVGNADRRGSAAHVG